MTRSCVYAIYASYVSVLSRWFTYRLSMVPSRVAGCRLLTSWLHAGYRMTYNLVTGSRSRTPMRVLLVAGSRSRTYNMVAGSHSQSLEVQVIVRPACCNTSRSNNLFMEHISISRPPIFSRVLYDDTRLGFRGSPISLISKTGTGSCNSSVSWNRCVSGAPGTIIWAIWPIRASQEEQQWHA